VQVDLLKDLVQSVRWQTKVIEDNFARVLLALSQPSNGGAGIEAAFASIIDLLQTLATEATLETVSTTLSTFMADWIAANTPTPPSQATTGTVSVRGPQGVNMPLTVDSTGQNLIFQFDDDHGDVAAPPAGDGSGLVVTLTSDNTAVASVGSTVAGTDANGNAEYTAPLTFGVDGTFNAGATVANSSGAALLDDDGVTAFVQPASVSVSVAAGQATTGTVSEG
jgi:hypothetical protein